MVTSWKHHISLVCLALFLALTAVSFNAAVSQAAGVSSPTQSCVRGPIYR